MSTTVTRSSSSANILPSLSDMMKNSIRGDPLKKLASASDEAKSGPCSPYSSTDAEGCLAQPAPPASLSVDVHPHQKLYEADRPQHVYGLPSPVSQSSTRCPSYTESMACHTPSEHSPATPTSGDLNSPTYLRDPRASHYSHLDYGRRNTLSSHSSSMIFGMGSSDMSMPKLSEEEDQRLKSEKRRRNHLNSEKRRRENIKGGMDALVDLVPTCRNITESKANILRKTKDYILQLVFWQKQAQDEMQRLRNENAELRRMLQPMMSHPNPTDLSCYQGGQRL